MRKKYLFIVMIFIVACWLIPLMLKHTEIKIPVGYKDGHFIEFGYVCYGDLCPHNGGWHTLYRNFIGECPQKNTVSRFSGWGYRDIGCSPWESDLNGSFTPPPVPSF